MNVPDHHSSRPGDGPVWGRRDFLGRTAGVAAGAAFAGALASEPASASQTSGEPASASPTPAAPTSASPAAFEARPVRTESGLVSGVPGARHGVTAYKGIPYAASTAGENRWRAPRPAPAWKGVRKADTFGDAPPQAGSGFAMSEDCLNLNVWTGASNPGARRPVYVWLYGGGFSGGMGSDPLFDGSTLAGKGVVVVTINYRLGALGFLSTPELSRESGHDASGNYGLLDQIAALKWVRRNIRAFGGDPDQVTVGGQSAGAGSTDLLSISPLATGLFRRAVAQSQVRFPSDPELRYLGTSHRKKSVAEQQGASYAADHGATTLAELRALPWQDINDAATLKDETVDTGTVAKPPLFRPVIDGWVLPLNARTSGPTVRPEPTTTCAAPTTAPRSPTSSATFTRPTRDGPTRTGRRPTSCRRISPTTSPRATPTAQGCPSGPYTPLIHRR